MSEYPGTELDLFASATHWKSYLNRQIRRFIGKRVLEVGAGIGTTTSHFIHSGCVDWCCLEPDPKLAARIEQAVAAGELPPYCHTIVGTLNQIPPDARYDTIIYMDVLEHIADDADEVAEAASRLCAGGHLIVLSPAHPWLFTAFDKAVGHYRRYTKESLRQLTPTTLRLVRLDYLDSVGMLASIANRVLLKSASPSSHQIAFWDRILVRLSRMVDPLLTYRVGKSVLAVWVRLPGGD